MASFSEFELLQQLLRGIYTYGFETPSEVQTDVLPVLCSGRDVIAQARSGTGKTGAFAIATLQGLESERLGCAVVLCSTRELAQQTLHVVRELGQFCERVRPCLCVGGDSVSDNVRRLHQANLLIGTPGRLRDLLCERASWYAKHVQLLVVDEADQFLQEQADTNSFLTVLRDLMMTLPRDAQIALFSATMPASMVELTNKFMTDPYKLLRPPEQLTLEGIRQYYVTTATDQDKFGFLEQLFQTATPGATMVFCSTRPRVDWLAGQLETRGYSVGSIHGALTPAERRSAMQDFRDGRTRILVSSSLTARGIDVQTVRLVIQFDLNRNTEDYLHTVGRSGRYGRQGVAIMLVTPRDAPLLEEIEAHYKTTVQALPAHIDL